MRESKTTTLITGASSGIGRELAKLFAADGDHVVLVARSQEKLVALAKQLRSDDDVQATVITSDLSKPAAVDELCAELSRQSIHIDSLVNNAGFGAVGRFADLPLDRQTDMLMVNLVALTRLTRHLLPAMIRRRAGGVLNVGSIAAYQAGPNMSVYYASKAYVLSFTEGLREELSGTGVGVTLLAPGPTQTGFGEDSGMGKYKFFQSAAMSAASVAAAGHRGFRRNQDVVIPGWRNRVMVAGVGLLPRVVTRKLVARLQHL